jgi:two-component system sensor histidine kinase YesM
MKLRDRLLVTYLLLISLPLALLGVIYYRSSLELLTEQAQDSAYQIVRKNNDVLDTRFAQIEAASRSLFVDKEMFDIFAAADPASDADILNMDRRLKAILNKYFSSNEDVFMSQLWTSYFAFGENRVLPPGDGSRSEIYRAAVEGEGRMVWTPTFDFGTMFGQDWASDADIEARHMFAASRLMNLAHVDWQSMRTLEPGVERPVLAVLFRADAFRALFENSFSADATYVVLGADDTVVAHSDESRATKPFGEAWVRPLFEHGSGVARIELAGEPTIVLYDRSDVTGWLSVVTIPQASLVKSLVPKILTSTLVLAGVLAVVAVASAFFVLGRITGPIKKLLVAMRFVGEGEFTTKVDSGTNDEFGVLIEKFNTMSDRIHTLVKENYQIRLKEQEAEIHALNMQMNPHFLYNTLNVMNWVAIENGQKELSKMLVSLSSMLHYTTRKDWDAVPLSEEVEWMKHYFYIMQSRFEDKFTVTYDIEPQLYHYKVPRLLFQPFVENAILHGFDRMETGGRIDIRGRMGDDRRFFEIVDNGRGMASETVQELLLRGDSPRIGVRNTISRIRMQYGPEAEVGIESAPSRGTTIRIALPFNTQ